MTWCIERTREVKLRLSGLCGSRSRNSLNRHKLEVATNSSHKRNMEQFIISTLNSSNSKYGYYTTLYLKRQPPITDIMATVRGNWWRNSDSTSIKYDKICGVLTWYNHPLTSREYIATFLYYGVKKTLRRWLSQLAVDRAIHYYWDFAPSQLTFFEMMLHVEHRMGQYDFTNMIQAAYLEGYIKSEDNHPPTLPPDVMPLTDHIPESVLRPIYTRDGSYQLWRVVWLHYVSKIKYIDYQAINPNVINHKYLSSLVTSKWCDWEMVLDTIASFEKMVVRMDYDLRKDDLHPVVYMFMQGIYRAPPPPPPARARIVMPAVRPPFPEEYKIVFKRSRPSDTKLFEEIRVKWLNTI